MNKDYRLVLKSLHKKWYVQGMPAVPVFLNISAVSGFVMKKDLGYGYDSFTFNYKGGFGEMDYLKEDLRKLWKIIRVKLAQDASYLAKMKKKYDETFKQYLPVFQRVESSRLQKVGNDQLLSLFKSCIEAQIYSVGIAHLLEPVGFGLEKEFKKKLFDQIADKNNFNRYLAILTTPVAPSFLVQEEADLKAIAQLPKKERRRRLVKHFQKYFWIQNNYAGPRKLTLKFFQDRLKSLAKSAEQKVDILEQKNKLIGQLKFSSEMQSLIQLIDLAAIWQDERKANILNTISNLGKVLIEVSRRTKVPVKLLSYLSYWDVVNLKRLSEFKGLKRQLATRSRGCFFLMKDGGEICLTGKFYTEVIGVREKISQKIVQKEEEIHGSAASLGTAVGRVVICKNLASLRKVKMGDVLVTSMTRPEFVPAIKKVVAIITDEGGVTSHAAIIAREFGIPAVIGTKIATKVLRDGMLVEVKANHGFVKIIG